MSYDVVIIGGGPAGLSAALALGRARKRVLLCDSGPRRNAAAVHVHNLPRPSSVFQLDKPPTAMAWDQAGRQLAMAASKSLHRASIGPRQSRARTA